MPAVEFLHYANGLAQDSALGAAAYRSAVSRAYYTAHHAARAFLRAVGLEAPDSLPHPAGPFAITCPLVR
jgi:uncharacterized protein (UPF0332 family)